MLFQSSSQDDPSTDEAILQADIERLSSRLAVAMSTCSQYEYNASMAGVKIQGEAWVYKPKNLAYCTTPKVGCTFWKRILRFLGHDYPGKNVSRPSDIDRMAVHYAALNTVQQRQLSNPITRTLLSQRNMHVFMFSRDPYSRLWSAYVDKFYLPDFWRSSAPGIASKFKVNATALDKTCGNNITFTDFLQYVTDTLSKGGNLNEHFNPMFKLCSPCHVRFDVIGKIETFQKDSEYIFKTFGLRNLSKVVSFSLDVEEEINMLIKYNFDLKKGIKKECYSTMDVAERLWKAFQINGHMSKDIPFPSKFVQGIANNTNATDTFRAAVMKIVNDQTIDKAQLKLQKRQFLVHAYRSVPVLLLKKIPVLFHQDFEIFGYEKYPKDIFN